MKGWETSVTVISIVKSFSFPDGEILGVESSIPGDKKDLSLTKYIELKDSKNFVISKGIKRCWLNEQSEENGSSGILFNHSTTEFK